MDEHLLGIQMCQPGLKHHSPPILCVRRLQAPSQTALDICSRLPLVWKEEDVASVTWLRARQRSPNLFSLNNPAVDPPASRISRRPRLKRLSSLQWRFNQSLGSHGRTNQVVAVRLDSPHLYLLATSGLSLTRSVLQNAWLGDLRWLHPACAFTQYSLPSVWYSPASLFMWSCAKMGVFVDIKLALKAPELFSTPTSRHQLIKQYSYYSNHVIQHALVLDHSYRPGGHCLGLLCPRR